MRSLLKNLGYILILIGVGILLTCFFTGYVNNNTVLCSSAALVIAGVITYIVINKKIVD